MSFDAVNLLDLAPVRCAAWRDEGGRVVVERPRPAGRGPRFLWRWLGYKAGPKTLRLDERGSFAWRALDGRSTVRDVAEALRREFGPEVEPVEERLGQLVRSLRQAELVSFPGLDSGA